MWPLLSTGEAVASPQSQKIVAWMPCTASELDAGSVSCDLERSAGWGKIAVRVCPSAVSGHGPGLWLAGPAGPLPGVEGRAASTTRCASSGGWAPTQPRHPARRRTNMQTALRGLDPTTRGSPHGAAARVSDQTPGNVRSKRFGEPLLQPRIRPLYVRNQRGAATSPDRP